MFRIPWNSDTQCSFFLEREAWHNHRILTRGYTILTDRERKRENRASARATCDATAGPLSGSQPAGLRESARARSGMLEKLEHPVPRSQSSVKRDLKICGIFKLKTCFILL